MSSKFRGKYLLVTPLGTAHCKFAKTGDHYTWKKVTTTVNNIIVGKLWIDQVISMFYPCGFQMAFYDNLCLRILWYFDMWASHFCRFTSFTWLFMTCLRRSIGRAWDFCSVFSRERNAVFYKRYIATTFVFHFSQEIWRSRIIWRAKNAFSNITLTVISLVILLKRYNVP